MDTFYRTRIFQPLVNACGRRWGFTTWGMARECFGFAQLAVPLVCVKSVLDPVMANEPWGWDAFWGALWLAFGSFLLFAWRLEASALSRRSDGHMVARYDRGDRSIRVVFMTMWLVGVVVSALLIIAGKAKAGVDVLIYGMDDLSIAAGLFFMTCDPAPPQETREHKFDAVPEGA